MKNHIVVDHGLSSSEPLSPVRDRMKDFTRFLYTVRVVLVPNCHCSELSYNLKSNHNKTFNFVTMASCIVYFLRKLQKKWED